LAPQASVNSASLPKPVLLAGLESMNRAVAGDLVVVEVLPESEWKSLGEEVVDEDGQSLLSPVSARLRPGPCSERH
jgi:exosome complex exonuclease DIS3/RRP44